MDVGQTSSYTPTIYTSPIGFNKGYRPWFAIILFFYVKLFGTRLCYFIKGFDNKELRIIVQRQVMADRSFILWHQLKCGLLYYQTNHTDQSNLTKKVLLGLARLPTSAPEHTQFSSSVIKSKGVLVGLGACKLIKYWKPLRNLREALSHFVWFCVRVQSTRYCMRANLFEALSFYIAKDHFLIKMCFPKRLLLAVTDASTQ